MKVDGDINDMKEIERKPVLPGLLKMDTFLQPTPDV
jgi:hypothetical protein